MKAINQEKRPAQQRLCVESLSHMYYHPLCLYTTILTTINVVAAEDYLFCVFHLCSSLQRKS